MTMKMFGLEETNMINQDDQIALALSLKSSKLNYSEPCNFVVIKFNSKQFIEHWKISACANVCVIRLV